MLLMLLIVSVTAMAKPTVPNKKVRVVEITNTSITVEWDRAIGENGNKTGIEYQVWYWEPVSGLTLEDYHMDPVPRKKDIDRWKITNLKPGQTYYVEVRCIEPGDKYWTDYEDLKLTTLKTKPIVTNPTVDILNVTKDGITISWHNATPTNGKPEDLVYEASYEWATSGLLGGYKEKFLVKGTNVLTMKDDHGKNESYHIKLRVRGQGEWDREWADYEYHKVTTPSTDEINPKLTTADVKAKIRETTTNVQVTVQNAYNIINGENSATGMTYQMYYRKSSDASWQIHPNRGIMTRPSGTGSIIYNIDNLEPNTLYDFLPVAINQYGNKVFYNAISLQTVEPDEVAPVLLSEKVDVENITKHSATVKWIQATDDKTPAENLFYNIRVVTPEQLAANEAGMIYSAKGENSIVIYDLLPSTDYIVLIRVQDRGLNITEYRQASFTTKDGIAPVIAAPKLSVSKYYAKGFAVEWTPAADDVTAQDELIYYVGIKRSDDLNFNIVATLKGETSYTFKTLSDPLSPYDVKIYVYDKAGNHSEYEVLEKIMHPHYFPIISDREVKTSNLTHNGVTLKWTEAYDELTPADEMNYVIFCDKDGLSQLPKVAEVCGTTSYTLSDLEPSTRYKIRIIAVNVDNNNSRYDDTIITTEKDPSIPEEYGLYVNGESVTSLNCTNAPSIRGKVTYNDKAKTLVLKDAELSSIDSRIPLNIVLEGYNTIKGNIVSKDNRLRFLGSGKLYVEGSAPCEVGDSLIIEGGCTVSLSGSGSYALGLALNQKGIYINASSLKVNGGGLVPSVIGCTELMLTDCEFLSDHSYVNSSFVDANGDTATDRIKIGPKDLIPPTLPADDDTPTIEVKDHEGAWIKWYRAEDNVSDENLTYEVYVKNAKADTYGAEPEYSDVLTSCAIHCLNPNTEYTVCVVACDAAGNKAYYKEVSFTTDPDPLEGRRYPVYIMGDQVNGDNCNDILGDGGSMTYDPDTRTLKLDNVTLSGNGQAIQAYEGINIDLVGTNIINTETGIFTTSGQSNIISGSGSLVVMSATPINGWGNIALTGGCTVELDATDCGTPAITLAYNTISVDGSTLKAKGDAPNPSIYGCSTLYLYGGTAITSGQRFDSASGQFFDAQGNMATDEIVITLRPGDVIAPTIMDDVVVVTNTTDSSISLSWTAASDNETKVDELSYGIELIGGGDGFFQDPGKSTSWTFTGLKPETTYTIKISVKDNAGNESSYKETTATTTSSLATSISDIQNNGGDSSIYGTDGVRRSSLKNGINIVITPDGKAVKMTRK